MAEFSQIQTQIIDKPQKRLGQRDLLPTAIKPRQFGEVIQRYSTYAQASVTALPNGSTVTFTATLESVIGTKLIMADIDRGTWIGSVSTANELGGVGSSIDLALYPTYGPYFSLTLTDGKNIKQVIAIKNASGGNQDIISRIQSRYIINQGGPSA